MHVVHCTTESSGTFRHEIQIGDHTLRADLGVPEGGTGTAPDPHDYFDASLAACKALTAMWYAKRNAMPLERVESHVERDAREERNGRYRLVLKLAFHGPLTDEQRTRIYAAVVRCPVAKLMTTTEVVIDTEPLEPPTSKPTGADVKP